MCLCAPPESSLWLLCDCLRLVSRRLPVISVVSVVSWIPAPQPSPYWIVSTRPTCDKRKQVVCPGPWVESKWLVLGYRSKCAPTLAVGFATAGLEAHHETGDPKCVRIPHEYSSARSEPGFPTARRVPRNLRGLVAAPLPAPLVSREAV